MTAFLIASGVWVALWITFKLGKIKGSSEMVEEAFGAGWRAHQLSEEWTDPHIEAQRQAGRDRTQ